MSPTPKVNLASSTTSVDSIKSAALQSVKSAAVSEAVSASSTINTTSAKRQPTPPRMTPALSRAADLMQRAGGAGGAAATAKSPKAPPAPTKSVDEDYDFKPPAAAPPAPKLGAKSPAPVREDTSSFRDKYFGQDNELPPAPVAAAASSVRSNAGNPASFDFPNMVQSPPRAKTAAAAADATGGMRSPKLRRKPNYDTEGDPYSRGVEDRGVAGGGGGGGVTSEQLEEALSMLRYDIHREVQQVIKEQIRQFAIAKVCRLYLCVSSYIDFLTGRRTTRG